jgi:hypothetical protein
MERHEKLKKLFSLGASFNAEKFEQYLGELPLPEEEAANESN